jgi:hypothetical protein
MMAQAAPPAAVVSKIEGNAVASQGERYVTVHDGMRLVEGDRLMVLEGGQAVVTFNDGCRLDLPEMAILSVQAGSICALNGVGVYQPAPESGVASGTPPNPSWRRLVPERPVAKRNATWRQGTITPTMTAIATSGATTLTRMTTTVLAVGWPGLVALGGVRPPVQPRLPGQRRQEPLLCPEGPPWSAPRPCRPSSWRGDC